MQKSKAWMVMAGATAVALAAGLVLPPEAYLGLMGALLLAALGAIALVAQLDRPLVGMTILVVTAAAFPLEFRGPAGVMMSSSLPLAAVFCGLWLLRLPYGAAALDASRVVYATAAFMTVAVLAFVVGQFPLFPSGGAPLPAQVVELGLFLLSGCLLLAVGHQIRSVNQLQTLTWLFLAAGAVTCVLQMAPEFRFIARWTTRPGSVGSLFWTWLVALSFAQVLFNRDLKWPVRLALLALTGLVMFHGLVQVRSWASGWVPPLIAIGLIVLLRVPRVSLGLGLVGVPVGLFLATSVSTWLLEDEAYSLVTRQEAWSVLWQLIERNPLLGTGMANYYYYTENLPILGWYVRFISHNNYQDLVVQTGFLGLFAFIWLACEMLWMMRRLYARVPAGFAKAYVVGAFGGLVGSLASGMLGDWIIPFYYNAGVLGFRSSLLFWVFLGGVLALKRIAFGGARATVPAYRQDAFARRPQTFQEAL